MQRVMSDLAVAGLTLVAWGLVSLWLLSAAG